MKSHYSTNSLPAQVFSWVHKIGRLNHLGLLSHPQLHLCVTLNASVQATDTVARYVLDNSARHLQQRSCRHDPVQEVKPTSHNVPAVPRGLVCAFADQIIGEPAGRSCASQLGRCHSSRLSFRTTANSSPTSLCLPTSQAISLPNSSTIGFPSALLHATFCPAVRIL